MNSATTMLLALVPAGGHIITTTDCYRRTRQFIQTVLPKMGITATVIDPSDMEVTAASCIKPSWKPFCHFLQPAFSDHHGVWMCLGMQQIFHYRIAWDRRVHHACMPAMFDASRRTSTKLMCTSLTTPTR